MPAVCIDIDNVLARTDEIMREVIYEHTHGRVKFDYQDIVEFDYWKCKDQSGNGITKKEWTRIHDLFSEPRYLWKVLPYSGAIRELRRLAKTFDIHVATSRLPKARKTTIDWIESFGFPPHDLHFVKHGQKHVSLGTFVAAVEDHYEQAADFAKSGTPCFLLEHPWNSRKPRRKNLFRVKTWSELRSQLLDRVTV